MTGPVDLEAIEARLAAATPGPWEPRRGYEGWDLYAVDGTPVVVDAGLRGQEVALIAHAPSDLAACVAEIRALRKVVVGAAETVSQGFLDPLLEVFAEYDEAMGE